MLRLIRISFGIVFLMILSGCVQNNTSENIIIEENKKPIIDKDINKVVKKQKTKKLIKKAIKKTVPYKYCTKHTKIMNYASSYISTEFDKGYFIQKDVVGAKAQLFLIESKSPSLFAKNINDAQESYLTQYKLAKKHKCNLKKYRVSPLSKIKNRIKTLEKEKAKN